MRKKLKRDNPMSRRRQKLLFSNIFLPSIMIAATINVPADYATIQGAIDASISGDSVVVAAGTYTENINFNGKNIAVVSLLSSTNDYSYIDSTIIDGGGSGSVVTMSNSENVNTVLAGFTIQNGSALNGGGIYLYGSTPQLHNLTIKNNIASSKGAGMYLYNADATIQSINVENNTCNAANYTEGGGGIYIEFCDPTFYNIEVYNNSTGGSGGGIFINQFSNPTFNVVYIDTNSAQKMGGGVYINSNYSSPSFMNFYIRNNSVSVSSWSNVMGGGGVHCYYADATFDTGVITGNSTTGYGGGVHLYYNANATFNNVTIANNSSGGTTTGGGIHSNTGTGISHPTLTNCIIARNSPKDFKTSNSTWESYYNITYSLITDGFAGEGNISGNPLFCDMNSSDYTLASNSPCIGSDEDGGNMGFYDVGCTDLYAGPTWHVDTAGSDASGYGSETEPYATIEFAISLATAGDTILVGPGTYTDNIQISNAKRLTIGSHYLTTLDTSYISSTILDGGGSTSSPVLQFKANSDSTHFSGFTLTNSAYAGVYCNTSTSLHLVKTNKVSHSIISNNSGNGGVQIEYSNLILSNVVIKDNSDKGGLVVYYNSHADVSNSIIENNSGSGNYTAGITTTTYADLDISNSIIRNNSGEGIDAYLGTITAENLTIEGNGGNGIYVNNASISINRGSISNNGGTGYYGNDNSANFDSLTVINNGGDGLVFSFQNATVRNSVVADNDDEGIVGQFHINLNIDSTTIANNSSNEIYLRSNVTLDLGSSIIYDDESVPHIVFDPNTNYTASNMTVHNSNIYGGSGGINTNNHGTLTWGTGNIDDNPWFCDADSGDYTLAANSACIGAGENGGNMGAHGAGCSAIIGPVLSAISDQEIQEDDTLNITVTAVSDIGDEVEISAFGDTADISVTVTDSTLLVIPAEDWNGYSVITVIAEDEFDLSDSTTFVLTVTPVNDAPAITLPQLFALNEDDSSEVDFLSYISDVDGDSSLLLTYSGNMHIDVSIDSFKVTFSADSNWNGQEQIAFTIDDQVQRLTEVDTVTVSVLAVNDPPEIFELSDLTMDEDSVEDIILSAMDIDGDSIFTYTASSDDENVILDVNLDTLIVSLAEDWSGNASVMVVVMDASLYDSTTFSLTVNSVNDPPNLDDIEVAVNEDDSVEIVFTALDVDGDSLTFSTLDDPRFGDYADGVYTPEENFNGVDTFAVRATDGVYHDTASVIITVNPVNDAPESFSLLYPADNDTIFITEENIDDTLRFVWKSTNDVDEDSLTYQLWWYSGTGLLIVFWDSNFETENDTTVWMLLADVPDILTAQGWTSASGEWTSRVRDGIDTTFADSPFFLTFDISALLSVDASDVLPEFFSLHQNYPNPFNPTTVLKYDLPEDAFVSITIYDITGRIVQTMVNAHQNAGFKSILWNGTNSSNETVSAGMYFYTIEAGNFRDTKKMILLK